MKIIHIASFNGNIGDNVSHAGLSNILDNFFTKAKISKLEMRRTYRNYTGKNPINFNSSFIKYINKFDLIIFGGGGYFDFSNNKSKTSTYYDIDIKLISLIKKPTIFSSIGAYPFGKINKNNIKKFKQFINAINENKKIEILLRNDGSDKIIKSYLGPEYLKKTETVLDSGFFFKRDISKSYIKFSKKYVVINITYDQSLIYGSNNLNNKSKSIFLEQISKTIEYLINKYNYNIVLMPHIASDLFMITKLFNFLSHSTLRSFVSIAPCVQGDEGARLNFDIYYNSEIVLASRLHANIGSMVMKKNLIGITSLDRIKYLHDSMLSDSYVKPDKNLFINIKKLLKKDNKKYEKKIYLAKRNTINTYKKIFKKLELI